MGVFCKSVPAVTVTKDEQQHRALPRAAPSPRGAQGVLENGKGGKKAGREEEIPWEDGVAGVGAEAQRAQLTVTAAPAGCGRAVCPCPQPVPCPSQPAQDNPDHCSFLLSVIQK